MCQIALERIKMRFASQWWHEMKTNFHQSPANNTTIGRNRIEIEIIIQIIFLPSNLCKRWWSFRIDDQPLLIYLPDWIGMFSITSITLILWTSCFVTNVVHSHGTIVEACRTMTKFNDSYSIFWSYHNRVDEHDLDENRDTSHPFLYEKYFQESSDSSVNTIEKDHVIV